MIERSGATELATTVALVALRGPVPLAKTLATLDVLSDGRVIAGLDEVGNAIAHHPEIPFAGAITGPANLVASITTRDSTSLYAYLAELPTISALEAHRFCAASSKPAPSLRASAGHRRSEHPDEAPHRALVKRARLRPSTVAL